MGSLVVGVAVALAALACSGDADESGAAGKALEPAPDFTLPVLDGGTLSLADLRGKTVVIDFWATWCPPCEYQVPELNAFYEAHKEADVAVIGISVDTEGPEVVSKWTKEKGVEYPILLGDEELARQFGALGFPTVVIVSPDGHIQTRHMGLIERDELEDAFAGSGEST
jgi:peroxiredoxin